MNDWFELKKKKGYHDLPLSYLKSAGLACMTDLHSFMCESTSVLTPYSAPLTLPASDAF